MKPFLFVIFSCFAAITFGQTRSLQYFIDKGIGASPLLKDLNNQVALNSLDSMLIIAAQKPQVTFTSNNNYAPVIKGYGYDNAITNGANISALMGVSKSLFNRATNKVQFANLQLLVQSARNNALITQQDIKKAIIDQYIIAYGDMLQVDAATAIQDMMDKQEKVLKILTQKSVYRQVDYLSFFVTLQQNNFKLRQLTNQYSNDYAMLNYLVGNVDTSKAQLEEPGLSINQLPDASQSVFFKKYTLDSLTLANSRRLLDVAYRPKVNVYADAGYNSSLVYQPYKNIGASAGISLIIPIFDGRQKKLQYSKIDLQENTRVANRQFFINQYTQQINQLQKQFKAVSDLASDINLQLKYIETLISVNEKLLQTGEVKIYDYIMSINNFLNAKSMINDNKVSKWQIINQINYWNR